MSFIISGHSDPRWLEAVVEQAGTLAHTSNLFHSVPQVSTFCPAHMLENDAGSTQIQGL